MKEQIERAKKEHRAWLREQEKPVSQLNKEYHIYGYRIDLIKNTGLFRRIKEMK